MSDERSFAELLADAPRAADEKHVTLVGTLGKSDDPKTFVLYVSDGSPHTIDVAAVKKHTVLGHSVGRAIVQIEVDREHLPESLSQLGGLGYSLNEGAGTGVADIGHTTPVTDHLTIAIFDVAPTAAFIDHGTPAYLDTIGTIVGADQHGTLQETISDPGTVIDPALRYAGAGISPFSLALQHHVAQAQIEALASWNPGQRTYYGYPTPLSWGFDHHPPIFKVISDPGENAR